MPRPSVGDIQSKTPMTTQSTIVWISHLALLPSLRAEYHESETYQPSGICGSLRQLAHSLTNLDPSDPVRIKTEKIMLEKLYDMGILSSTTKLSEVERKVGVSRLARRRLGVVMTRLRMAENVTAAVKFVEQGHVRVGTEVVTDPAFLVTRNMEDFVTWVDSSKVKRNILKYREKLDDFDLL